MRRLLDDVRTLGEIVRRKRSLKSRLQQSAARCAPGLWYLEGPYARHRSEVVPEALRDAIRGIRRRRLVREVVERLAPPWAAWLSPGAAMSDNRCSIAYLSNGGKWKLFDLEAGSIWTRLDRNDRTSAKTVPAVPFDRYFDIPASEVVTLDGSAWQRERYIGDRSLARCATSERMEIFKLLLRQYRAFAASEASAPAPEITHASIRTIRECAPGSFPARMADKHVGDLETLARSLKLLPAHGDLSGQNVFVAGGVPWIIDWDGAGRRLPMLYDVLYLVTREAELGRHDLLQALLDGAFDEDMLELLHLNGLSTAPGGNLVLLVHAYLIHFHRKTTAGQRDADRRNVDDLWDLLVGYCALDGDGPR